jgi:phage terminase Nu1 subunit (DNA packaging protein)
VHALKPQALRNLAGMSEGTVASIARVGRGLVRAYEADREGVKTPTKRARLDRFYAALAAFLAERERDAARDDDEGDYDEAEGPRTVPSRQAA